MDQWSGLLAVLTIATTLRNAGPRVEDPLGRQVGSLLTEKRNQPAWLLLSRSRRPRHRTCTSTTTLSGGLQRPVPGHRRVPLLAALPSYLSAVAMPSRTSFRGISSAFPRVPGTTNPFAVPASVVDVSSPNGFSTRWRASEYRQVPRAWARGALVESTVSSTAIEDTTPLRSDADGCHSVF